MNDQQTEGADVGGIGLMILTQLAEARDGSAKAAVMTAMLIHLYPQTSGRLGVSAQYDWLLSKALQASDAELLVCTAEEIIWNKRLALNVRLAHRFFTRADGQSSFMSAYALGRLFAHTKNPKAIRYLRKARKAGHFPATILEHKLIIKKYGLLGGFLKIYFQVTNFYRVWRALSGGRPHENFWRYRDVVPNPIAATVFKLDPDRTNYFAQLDSFVKLHPVER